MPANTIVVAITLTPPQLAKIREQTAAAGVRLEPGPGINPRLVQSWVTLMTRRVGRPGVAAAIRDAVAADVRAAVAVVESMANMARPPAKRVRKYKEFAKIAKRHKVTPRFVVTVSRQIAVEQ